MKIRNVVVLTVLFLLLLLPVSAGQSPRLGKLLGKIYPEMRDDDRQVVLVSFADKGDAGKSSLFAASPLVSERSMLRRAKVRERANVVDAMDLPVEHAYVEAVRQRVVVLRHELKWFNAVSVVATRSQIDALAQLPFVTEIELVTRWKRSQEDERPQPIKENREPVAPAKAASLDYGASLVQNSQINVPAVHDLGIYGQGVIVGVFDNGFRNPSHKAFDSMKIVAQYDFVDHKVSVVPNAPATGFGSHGVWTLSTIGGYVPGQLIGPAFKASYILARTENDSSETPVEEDNWAKAIEWADSIGVDVTSTSLGYLTYDAPYTSLTWQDMDGATALITRAADRAVSLGIVVVNSAGNEGSGDGTKNTLIAPADGVQVITAGAVNSSGARASFSSVGPTTDIPPRIKPDIMAMGVGVRAASSVDAVNYVNVNGTSFSCPLSAGVAALILSANPSLTPFQVREAMRNTASNAATPNNQFGWGILNALAAVNYYGVLPFARIDGSVFHDLNGDGVHVFGEAGLAGVTVRLSGTLSDTALTDTLGNFTFVGLPVGAYSVSADPTPGWIQTVPQGGPAAVSVDSLQSTTGGVEFGLMKPVMISGTVFHDLNVNGVFDAGDSGRAGNVLHLSGPSFLRTVSDVGGHFAFGAVAPGAYVLRESTETGWIQTVPPGGGHSVAVVSAVDASGLLFGSYFSQSGEYPLAAGWNLLSLPRAVQNLAPSALYPGASSPAFVFDIGYRIVDSIPNGVGYWLNFDSASIAVLTGPPLLFDTIDVVPGWNLVGAPSAAVAVSSVVQLPESTLVTGFYEYGLSQYLPADSLRPHRGYWVKAGKIGRLILNGALFSNTLSGLPGRRPPDRIGLLSLRDNAGREQRLIVNEGSDPYGESSELPPVPPAGAFDVRFLSSRAAEFLPGGSGDLPLLVSSASYPLTVEWNPSNSAAASLSAGRTTYTLAAGRPVRILHPSSLSLSIRPSEQALIPASFALDQNYPNPFNPNTIISFAVAAPARVTVRVFSVLGEAVATLVDEDLPPGTFQAAWNAESVPSGVYYYSMRAGNFLSTRKMLLIR